MRGTIEKEELLNFFSYIPAGSDEGRKLGQQAKQRGHVSRVHHKPREPEPATWGSFLNQGPLIRILFIRVPYYTGDLKRDPSLENYPHVVSLSLSLSLFRRCSLSRGRGEPVFPVNNKNALDPLALLSERSLGA